MLGAASAKHTLRRAKHTLSTSADAFPVFPTFFLLGFGLLLPWNVIVNCIPAFQASLGASRYAFLAPLAFNSPQLPVQLLQLCLGERLPPAHRLYAGFALQAALLALLPFALPLGLAPVLAGCALSGAATAALESALFGAAGQLGGEAGAVGVRAILVGEGAAALLASLVQLGLHADPALGASAWAVRAYFLAACVFMLGCRALLPRLGARGGGSGDGGGGASEDAEASLEMVLLPLNGEGEGAKPPASNLTLLALLARVWPTALAIFLAMFFSFLVFPGALTEIAYTGGSEDFFSRDPTAWALLLFFLFQLGDLSGRWVAGLPCIGGGCTGVNTARARVLAIVAYNAARAAFLPLFYVASRPGGAGRVPGGPAALAAAVLAFGVSNGHAATLAMVAGAQLVEARHSQQASTLHVLFLIAGLWAGAAGGLLFAPPLSN